MTPHTEESVLAEFDLALRERFYWFSPERRMAAALAEARNEIEDQRREIVDLSAFTQTARDAANDLNDEPAIVVLTRARNELARVRLIVDAARECATRRLDTGLMTALHILAQSIHAADADASTDLTTVPPIVGSAWVCKDCEYNMDGTLFPCAKHANNETRTEDTDAK